MAEKEEAQPSQSTPALPEFYNLLSDSDKEGYNQLRTTLSSRNCRNRRNKRLETFSEMLNAIQTFALRNDDSDWKRCLVCGVLWLSNGIAINTRQMRLLIDKCKSSINGSLHRMGYSAVMCRGDTSNQIVELIPMLKNNFPELRQWTVRQMNAWTPQPSLMHTDSVPPIKASASISPQPQPQTYFNMPTSQSIPSGFVDSMISSPQDEMHQSASFFDDPFALPLQEWVTSPPQSPQSTQEMTDLFTTDFTTDFSGF
ncbi:hypothetical protein TRFO_06244 [Tritrichomonas foetus]|uniref:Initiator binding domain-containing protein n=1 Tax=Tritrichomonas foetus TaxID=1144522 RepID=A0A1J4K4Z6_9EUKA|nr:hypothetical protein TRFO_06244 [Tritrichomonas foetus]|eukprot:OHT04788.1 hypothetical protein TRFO_06244 [Tritrichomonas foetus]